MKGVVLFVNSAGFPIGPSLRCSEILSAHVARRVTSVVRRRQLDSCGSDSDVHRRSLTLNRSWRPIGNFQCLHILYEIICNSALDARRRVRSALVVGVSVEWSRHEGRCPFCEHCRVPDWSGSSLFRNPISSRSSSIHFSRSSTSIGLLWLG